jgi:hypothetical protein
MKPSRLPLLLVFILTATIAMGQTQRVVVNPSKDTTVVTFTATTTVSTSTVTIPSTPTPPPDSSAYQLTFENDFAQASDLVSDQLGLGSFVTKDGRGAFKSRVNGSTSTSAGYRSEQQYTQAAANPIEGAAEWEVNYETVFASNGHSFQWHPSGPGTSGASANLALWHDASSFFVVQKLAGDQGVYQPAPLLKIQPNKWYKMRVEYRFSTGNDGYFRWFIDGVLYYKRINTPTAFNNSGQYVKIGQNRWSVSTESVAYYRNFKVFKRL